MINNCDCVEGMSSIEDNSIDFVFVDPPYAITANKEDTTLNWEAVWFELERICKPVSAIAITASQPFTSDVVSTKRDCFKHEWIWIKNRGSNFLNTKREPMKEHESVLIFSFGKWKYNRIMEDRSPEGYNRSKMPLKSKTNSKNYGSISDMKQTYIGEKRVPRSHQFFKTAAGKVKTKHPTQKPVDLVEYFIKTYSDEGDRVLDFCMGSGTTGVAACNQSRKFVGFELREEYFQIAKERIDQAKFVTEAEV